MRTPEELYRFHVTNLRSIETALDRVILLFRDAVARGDEKTISAFVRLTSLLLATWAECRLSKLQYEPNAFSPEERHRLRSETTQLDKWMKLVEIAFRKQYKSPNAPLSELTLPHSANSRYQTLRDILGDNLRSVIEVRNKLAHGQWTYTLNTDGDDVAQENMEALRKENLLSLEFKRRLLNNLADSIHDLAVSKQTFERDFDTHFRQIVQTRQNLLTRQYHHYERTMRAKFAEGVNRRRHGIP